VKLALERGWTVQVIATPAALDFFDPAAIEALTGSRYAAVQPAMGLPIVVLPFVNAALASRAPFLRNVESLRAESVSILLGPGEIEPHQPHTGGSMIDATLWHLGLDKAESMLGNRQG